MADDEPDLPYEPWGEGDWAAGETLFVLPEVGTPELCWPLREREKRLDLDDLIDIAVTRLKGRQEYSEVVAEVSAARR